MRSIPSVLTPLLILCLVAAVAPGCEGCSEATSNDDGGPGTLPPNNGGPGTGNGDGGSGTVAKRTLQFDGMSPVEVFYGTSTTLAFRLRTDEGAGVPGETVSFSTSGTGGQLNVLETSTDSSGVARVTFTAGTSNGDVTVTATADNIQAPAQAVVRVRVNPNGTLQMTVTSGGRIAVTRAEVLVYRGAAGMVPTCAQLEAAQTPPTATFAADFTAVPSSRTFAQQPQGTVVTARASGYGSNGTLIATACAEGAAIVGGQTTSMSLALQQLPTKLDGDYDVRMEIDLGNALPEPYEGYVDTVTAILADPAGYAVYQALKRSDEGGVTDFTYWDPYEDGSWVPATYEEIAANADDFDTWRIARSYVDQLLINEYGEDYTTITTIGGDLRRALTAFEVGSRFALTPNANGDGTFDVDEQWNDLVFTWRMGCGAGDTGCARRLVALDDTDYSPVATQYLAAATHAATMQESERFRIDTEPHLFSLRYGAILMIAMNEVVFPNLPPDLAGNNFEEVLNNLVDCVDVGQSIYDALYPFGDATTYEGFCRAGLGVLAQRVEDRVLELEVGAGTPELGAKQQSGALGGGTFYLVDADHDVVADTVAELTLLVQWNDPDAGGVNEDISAPITGDGRRAATGCDSDAACPIGSFCTPVAHYLKVKAAEMTCSRPVGDALGEESCTAHAQCTTGLCVGASQGVAGTCFSACADDNACGMGTCTPDAATVSLEPVLMGLGEVTLSSCVLP